MAGGPEVEEAGGGDVAGAPAVRFSARRKRWSRRISWVLRVAVRSTVATANGVGDDELRSGACREENRGGNGVQGKRGEVQGVEASPWRREGVGEAATAKQEVAEAASALATELLRCEGRKMTRGRRWAGPPGGGAGPATGKWPRWPFSPFFSILFLFSISVVLFLI